jgi:uncharacterized membrane protein YphA (DoxX/SURF4 family)
MKPPVLAHVIYVTPDEPSPDPLGFILATLADPFSLALLIGGFLVALVGLLAWLRRRPVIEPWQRLVDRAWTYRELVPWMLRLSFGLVLIGSGLSRTVFAPDAAIGGWPYILLTALGFLLLVGFAVRLAALVGLAAYGVALLMDPELVVIWDVAGGLAAVALVGPGHPSLDDLLRAAFPRGPGARLANVRPQLADYEGLVPLVIRIALGGALLSSAVVDKFLSYQQGLATVDKYSLTSVVPVSPELWVVGAGFVEGALGIAVLVGLATRVSAVAAFAVLTLTVFALPDDPVIAHVGLFGTASMLVVLGAGRWSVDAWLERRDGALGGRRHVGAGSAVGG